jgi:glycosyltransferase involved in cell wall biosynthesis
LKNVVIIGSAYPLRGGLATYNERLARAFAENGDKAVIHTFSLQYPNFLFPGKTQYSEGPAPKDLDIRVTVNSINPLSWIKVGRMIKKQKPDLVIVKFWLPFMGPCFGTILRIIRKNKHTKVISIIDNIIPHEKRPGDRALSNYFVKAVDGFIAMSKAVLNDLATFDKNKPKLYSPHPLYDNFGALLPKEEAKKKLGLDPKFDYMLFFGFIRDYKGLDLLIEAFGDERFRKLPVKLVIAGEYYSDPAPYIELIKKHKLEEHIIQKTDFIPDNEVAPYFCASDIVVQPYKDATQSGVTQIAYHFERPMLVTNVGGLPEMIPHGKVGYVVEPIVKDIADALIDFYTKNREQEFVPNVASEKQKYSWSNMIGTIESLYQQI